MAARRPTATAAGPSARNDAATNPARPKTARPSGPPTARRAGRGASSSVALVGELTSRNWLTPYQAGEILHQLVPHDHAVQRQDDGARLLRIIFGRHMDVVPAFLAVHGDGTSMIARAERFAVGDKGNPVHIARSVIHPRPF